MEPLRNRSRDGCSHACAGLQVPILLPHAAQVKFDTTKSDALMAEAREVMPGGVSSPVRAFKSVGGEPVVFDRVKGSKAYDVDGNEYVDYVGTWGPAIVGHADDGVLAAITETMQKGTSFGAPCALENELAKMVIDAVPAVEMVRFTNSGTEACMGVLRLMRAYTGREKVIKFEGCYHGHADSFLVAAGSGVITLGLPDSPGARSALEHRRAGLDPLTLLARGAVFGGIGSVAAPGSPRDCCFLAGRCDQGRRRQHAGRQVQRPGVGQGALRGEQGRDRGRHPRTRRGQLRLHRARQGVPRGAPRAHQEVRPAGPRAANRAAV